VEEKRNLYIPQGLKLKKEIFSGFGKTEIIRAIMVFVCLLVVNLIIFLIKRSSSIFIVATLSAITASIMIAQKDDSNLSVYDQVKFIVKFQKSQKYYPYKYLSEWGEVVEK
jgi:hypothetical protein